MRNCVLVTRVHHLCHGVPLLHELFEAIGVDMSKLSRIFIRIGDSAERVLDALQGWVSALCAGVQVFLSDIY